MLVTIPCVLLFSPNKPELFYSCRAGRVCRAAAGSISRCNSNKMKKKAVQGDKRPKCSKALHTTNFTKQLLQPKPGYGKLNKIAISSFLNMHGKSKEIMCIARNK